MIITLLNYAVELYVRNIKSSKTKNVPRGCSWFGELGYVIEHRFGTEISPSRFGEAFGTIWERIGEIWENLGKSGKIWENLGKVGNFQEKKCLITVS